MWGRRLAIMCVLGTAAICGCDDRFEAICLEADDCVNGNEADLEACVIYLERLEDQADVYGCDEEWEDYFSCFESNNRCDDDGDDKDFEPKDKCDDEAEDLKDCWD